MTKPSKSLRLIISRVTRDGKAREIFAENIDRPPVVRDKIKEGMSAEDIRRVIRECAERTKDPILEIDLKVTDIKIEPLPEGRKTE